MTDNACCYRLSNDFRRALGELDARHILIKPHCPWQNGKVERFNRTLQVEWPTGRSLPATHFERAPLHHGWRAIATSDPTVLWRTSAD